MDRLRPDIPSLVCKYTEYTTIPPLAIAATCAAASLPWTSTAESSPGARPIPTQDLAAMSTPPLRPRSDVVVAGAKTAFHPAPLHHADASASSASPTQVSAPNTKCASDLVRTCFIGPHPVELDTSNEKDTVREGEGDNEESSLVPADSDVAAREHELPLSSAAVASTAARAEGETLGVTHCESDGVETPPTNRPDPWPVPLDTADATSQSQAATPDTTAAAASLVTMRTSISVALESEAMSHALPRPRLRDARGMPIAPRTWAWTASQSNSPTTVPSDDDSPEPGPGWLASPTLQTSIANATAKKSAKMRTPSRHAVFARTDNDWRRAQRDSKEACT